MPERYKEHEHKEQEIREYLERNDISVLRRTRDGKRVNITLEELRKELEEGGEQLTFYDLINFGGCGCFVHEFDESLTEEGVGNELNS